MLYLYFHFFLFNHSHILITYTRIHAYSLHLLKSIITALLILPQTKFFVAFIWHAFMFFALWKQRKKGHHHLYQSTVQLSQASLSSHNDTLSLFWYYNLNHFYLQWLNWKQNFAKQKKTTTTTNISIIITIMILSQLRAMLICWLFVYLNIVHNLLNKKKKERRPGEVIKIIYRRYLATSNA